MTGINPRTPTMSSKQCYISTMIALVMVFGALIVIGMAVFAIL